MSPVRTRVLASRNPATAGMPRALAMMAVCEVGPPPSIARPMTCSRLSPAASEGDREELTTMTSSVSSDRSCRRLLPVRIACTRASTSSMNVATA